jgi:cell division protein FtsI (penicillin-binding protein 3)
VLFGQGLSVTALQSAQVFATIANDGVRVTPRLVSAVVDADGRVHPTPGAGVDPRDQQRRRGADAAHAGERRRRGGHRRARGDPRLPRGRQDGTAQAPDSSCGCYRGYTASFIGMAPADHPQLVVAIVLQAAGQRATSAARSRRRCSSR